eukprot:1187548-Rhodomonas_salina.1
MRFLVFDFGAYARARNSNGIAQNSASSDDIPRLFLNLRACGRRNAMTWLFQIATGSGFTNGQLRYRDVPK